MIEASEQASERASKQVYQSTDKQAYGQTDGELDGQGDDDVARGGDGVDDDDDKNEKTNALHRHRALEQRGGLLIDTFHANYSRVVNYKGQ